MSVSSELRARIVDLYAAYGDCIDAERFDEWPEFFTENAWYRIVARENYDRDLPLSIQSLKGKAMMKDRVYGTTSTIFHAPYYQRHIISLPIILEPSDGIIPVHANYVVIRTKRDMSADVYNVGRYIDEVVEEGGSLKFQKKFCVYDNDLVPNSLIYPI